MGLEGFSNNASGGMSPGDSLYAKTFNKLATAADKAQVGPSDGIIFTSNNGGVGIEVRYPASEQGNSSTPQQFQIFLGSVTQGQGQTQVTNPLISVRKGTLICTDLNGADYQWVDTFEKDCILPSGVSAWRGDNDEFIGFSDGVIHPGTQSGYLIPKNSGNYGIYLVQVSNQVIDWKPLIFIASIPTAEDDQWMYKLPTVIPDTVINDTNLNTYPVFNLLQIGTVKYDSEKKAHILDQWCIGTLTMPEPVKNGPQIPTWNPPAEITPAPFECRAGVIKSGGEKKLVVQVGKGSITYTVSNMPAIRSGAISNTYQAFYETVKAYYPGTLVENDNEDLNSPWMVGNGGYNCSLGCYLVAYKVDINTKKWSDETEWPFLEVGYDWPMLAMVDSDTYQSCFAETGPSSYSNYTNVQRMSGYNSTATGLPKDWGFCHTSWYNPMKIGINAKIIAKITAHSINPPVCTVERLQEPGKYRGNVIDIIRFDQPIKGGSVSFSFTNGDSEPNTTSANFYPGEEYARQLFIALNKINRLRGNILVSQTDELTFYVTYINHLQQRDYTGTDPVAGVYELDVLESNLEGYGQRYEIEQYHTGSLDLSIPLQFNGTQLMNKDGWTEADDWYNYNKDNDWVDIVNKEAALSIGPGTGYTISNTPPAMLVNSETPKGYTTTTFDNFYFQEGGCGEACSHPFDVHRVGQVGDDVVYGVCTGAVNNVIPSNIEDTFLGDCYVWVRCGYDAEEKVFPDPNDVTIGWGANIPDSDITASYVGIARIREGSIQQLVMSSLWGDRIQVGSGATQDAYYYYAQV